MKILHTADIHLREYGDSRWKTLERLLEIGKGEGIGIFAISGDLFDRQVDAEKLRPNIRRVFSDTGFKVVLIPGNHDETSYKHGLWFGEDIVILTNLRAPFEHQGVRIWGMAFERKEGERVLHELRSLAHRLTPDKRNIILYHGELLDAFFARGDFGDEGEDRYMPVKLSYFKNLGIEYVLAGHLHSSMRSWRLGDGGYFAYPGSPISITKREMGQRKVNLFEVGEPPREYLLDTPHYEEIIIGFDPFEDTNPVDRVKERLDRLHEAAMVFLTIKGFLDGKTIRMDETTLVEQIKQLAAERCIETRYEFKDIQFVLEDDLMKRFMDELDKAGYEEPTRSQLRDTAIRAIIDSRR